MGGCFFVSAFFWHLKTCTLDHFWAVFPATWQNKLTSLANFCLWVFNFEFLFGGFSHLLAPLVKSCWPNKENVVYGTPYYRLLCFWKLLIFLYKSEWYNFLLPLFHIVSPDFELILTIANNTAVMNRLIFSYASSSTLHPCH